MSTLVAIVGALPACTRTASGAVEAVAHLRNRDNGSVGRATLKEVEGGVEIRFEGEDLPPGSHGFHIHEIGECVPPNFVSAGGHFNPTHTSHGLDNPNGPHLGDLPNLEVIPNGRVVTEVIARGVNLDASGERSLLSGRGTALVIHAGKDDQHTDPAGAAGARIACGVIRRR